MKNILIASVLLALLFIGLTTYAKNKQVEGVTRDLQATTKLKGIRTMRASHVIAAIFHKKKTILFSANTGINRED